MCVFILLSGRVLTSNVYFQTEAYTQRKQSWLTSFSVYIGCLFASTVPNTRACGAGTAEETFFLSIPATVDVVVTLRPLQVHNRTGGKT